MNIHPNGSHPLHIYKIGINFEQERWLLGDDVRARLGDKFFPAKVLEVETNAADPFQNRYYIHFGHVLQEIGCFDG